MPRHAPTVKADTLYIDFGNTLRILRDSRRLTQSELAAIVGLHRSSITNMELGRQHVTLDGLFTLAAGLRVEVAKLLPRHNPFKGSKR